MIEFHSSITPEIRAEILSQLDEIERTEDVRLLFAIESGSRAWGFPSPDSDYDVRFVYARPADWYLSIHPGRDVIERPLEGDWDVNGWDIKKAMGLLLKPNPVLLEWLSSPVRYRWDDDICSKLITFSKQVAHGNACLNHYRRLGERQWATYVDGREKISLKKYLYVVRPALAIRWTRMHPESIPPMNFQALMDGTDLDAEVTMRLTRLLEEKSKSKEMGDGSREPLIDDLVMSEFSQARAIAQTLKPDQTDLRPAADRLFREIIKVTEHD
ncbi:nucleotidyltransferase domain-containing protein [Parasphingorhabdus marina]|uniref:nucleotidyltransferase domain-containing protein n=1 Tax=Parasphingorhabdus marina TaxID=394732 RepID=UPI000940A6BC|nr:nucleotidyltransferase domain-containing protein [Parasphingorhabdus marina]